MGVQGGSGDSEETALDNHVWGGKEGGGESRKWGGKNLWLFADERDLNILPQRWKETETQRGEGVWGSRGSGRSTM